MWFTTYPQTLEKVVVTNAFCVVSHTLHADIETVRLTYVATTFIYRARFIVVDLSDVFDDTGIPNLRKNPFSTDFYHLFQSTDKK